MSESPKKRIPGPVLAVGVIAILWLALQVWPMLSGDNKGTTAKPTSQRPKTQKPMKMNEVVVRGPAPSADDGLWSTYHGGPELRGVAGTTLPDAPALLWRFQADAEVYFAPVSSHDAIYFGTVKGGVYALDFAGNELWSEHFFREPYSDGRPRAERFDAPVACFGTTLLAGAISGWLYALNTSDGQTRWRYDMDGVVLGTANLYTPKDEGAPASVYLIEQDYGILHSIDFETGKGLWKTEGVERCDGSPSIAGNAIVYGSCAAALHIFSTDDGHLIKEVEFDVDSQVAGGAAIYGDSAYVGAYSGRLFQVNLNSGKIIWTNEDSYSEIYELPAVNEDYVIFSSYDGSVYGLSRETGEKIWAHETDGLPMAPVIAGDKVVVTTDGILMLLDLATGKELWSYEISDMASSPALINGMIVVGADDGTITAFGNPAPTKE